MDGDNGTRSISVLCVDDDPGILLTLPAILKQHGFDVVSSASVSEALAEINRRTFNVLISDLNIGQPGDGFTVVSAMRRTQPDCITLILTGYPAFESALRAIQSQVDDYLVKPADPVSLVHSIEKRLLNRQPRQPIPLMRLAPFLRENLKQIEANTLQRMKTDPILGAIPMTDEQRVDHLPQVLQEVAEQLESERPERPTEQLLRSGVRHGRQRLKLGYELGMLVTDAEFLDWCVYDLVEKSLLQLDVSNLVPELKRFNRSLQAQLRKSIEAFREAEGPRKRSKKRISRAA